MKIRLFNPFVLLLLFIYSSSLTAQERTLTGLVTTFESIAVANAEVKVLSSKIATLTDSLGNFEIKCSPGDKILISAKGFISQKIKIEEKTKKALVNLKIKSNEKNLDVAVGYGHISEKDRLHAITTMRNDKPSKFLKYTNMYDLIRDSAPGVQIINGNIIIRGINSILGSSAALIVVDGNIVDSSYLEMLSPVNVKSVSVMKDGSSIYGSRGANGAVLIQMKKGED
jgi:TonB-dependent SusC/RagA subfamily outer membrane receptor